MNKDWSRYAKELRSSLINEVRDDCGCAGWSCLKYQTTPYESPKDYRFGGYALNDGTWLRFRTGYMTKSGKYSKIRITDFCRAKTEIGLYARFLRMMGVDWSVEMRYHIVNMLADMTIITNRSFECTPDNRAFVDRMVRLVMGTDPKPGTVGLLLDDRTFSIDPKAMVGMTPKGRRAMQNRGRALANGYRIWLRYDPEKSVRANAALCGVTPPTIQAFKRRKDEYDRMFENDSSENDSTKNDSSKVYKSE